MPQTDDWRLQGQHCLRDELLRFRSYTPPRPGFEHDHCEFCWTRFRTRESGLEEGVRAEGYVTVDLRWICEPCYEDFKVMFDWRLET